VASAEGGERGRGNKNHKTKKRTGGKDKRHTLGVWKTRLGERHTEDGSTREVKKDANRRCHTKKAGELGEGESRRPQAKGGGEGGWGGFNGKQIQTSKL